MKFDKKYKNIPVMELGDDTYLRTKRKYACCVCGQPTHFVEINYEAPFCSEECERAFTDSIDWSEPNEME